MVINISRGIRWGFAYKELLIIVAVLLVGWILLAYPITCSGKARATQTTCLSNQRQIAAAVLMYCMDHHKTMMPYHGRCSWTTELATYGGEDKLYDCPANPHHGNSTAPDYGINAGLFSEKLQQITNPEEVILTADSVNGVAFRTRSAIYRDIHAEGFVASFMDGHTDWLRANSDIRLEAVIMTL